jgi:hypothetical protein
MADKSEPGPDGIDAALAWLRGDINERSPRKLLARRTFARMLRESPEAPVLSILAAAIEDGRLIMKRKPGRRRRVQPQRIAAFVYQRTKAGVSVESAVKEAEDKFAVKSSTVYSAWSKWRPLIEQNPEAWGRI